MRQESTGATYDTSDIFWPKEKLCKYTLNRV